MFQKIKLVALGLAISFCTPSLLRAQDIHLSQFYENAAMRNPALTGIYSGDYKVGVNYHSQWSEYGVPFNTALVNAETKTLIQASTGDYLSFGLTAAYDKAGTVDFTSTDVYGAVNYNKCLGDEVHTYLSFGIVGGYIQRSMDITKMRTASQFINGSYSSGNATGENIGVQSIHHFDVGGGLSLNSSIGSKVTFYTGLAVYHLAQPKETFMNDDLIRLTMRWSGNMGLHAILSDRIAVTIHANYQYQQPYQEIMLGGLASYRANTNQSGKTVVVSAGCFYRVGDAIIPTFKLDYKNWALTASYDINLSGSRIYLSGVGGYELSLFTRGIFNHAKRPTDVMVCPRFEDMDGLQNNF